MESCVDTIPQHFMRQTLNEPLWFLDSLVLTEVGSADYIDVWSSNLDAPEINWF